MLNINIIDNTLHIRNINKESISHMYSIYKNTYDFSYATGVFYSIDYKQFSQQISQFITRQNVFFLDICLVSTGEVIGFIKGLVNMNEKMVWINSLVINKTYQRSGYGKMAMGLLEKYLYQHFGLEKNYLSVYKNNTIGIKFWCKCGYEECNQLSKICLNKTNKKVTFMCKEI